VSTVTETVFDRLGRRFGYDERSAAVLVLPVFVVLARGRDLSDRLFVLHEPVRHQPDAALAAAVHRLRQLSAVFADPNFWIAVQRTTVYTVVTVAVTTVLAVAVALLLNEAFPAGGCSRRSSCCRGRRPASSTG
jgi:ABC-type sugar transport system permease subunit